MRNLSILKEGVFAAFVGLGLVACGGADPDDTRGGSLGNLRSGDTNGDTGSAGMGGTAGAGSFGNTTSPPPVTPNVDGGVVEECEEGERCYTDSTDSDDCGSQTLESDVETTIKPGNVLLVFDRSGSMDQDWNGQKRWQAAGTAISNALTPLTDNLTIGSVFFPSPDAPDPNQMQPTCAPGDWLCALGGLVGGFVGSGTCAVNPIDATDQISFQAGSSFLGVFTANASSTPIYAPVNGGRTPLTEGLQQAQAALAATPMDGVTSVIVITDGAPNCQWDQNASLQIVSDWQAMGINTYVVGLPGADGGAAVLTALAMAGGTGDYLTPDDSAALEMQLRDIATETVKTGIDSCSIELNPPAEAPDKLYLVATENGADANVPRDLGDGAGWTLSDDAATVTLEGSLCDDALSGRFDSIRFEFGCVDLPPLPPVAPPQ